MLQWLEYRGRRYTIDEAKKGALALWFPQHYIDLVCDERVWDGKPSVTQLINGTRLEYLRVLTPYGENPDDNAFRIIGSRGHAHLEEFAPVSDHSELSVGIDEIRGRLDLLEWVAADESNGITPPGEYWLTDTKTSGSYKVGQWLGLVAKKRQALDDNGEPAVYQKSGKWGKAGDPKFETYYEPDPAQADVKDVSLQLNMYRVLLKEAFGVDAKRLRVHAIVRDGNTVSARSRGLNENTYSIFVPLLPNEKVWAFIHAKSKVLVDAISAVLKDTADWDELVRAHIPPPCSKEESWDGNRCKSYCPVRELCTKIGNPYVTIDQIKTSVDEEVTD